MEMVAQKFESFQASKDEEYRYWQSASATERIAAGQIVDCPRTGTGGEVIRDVPAEGALLVRIIVYWSDSNRTAPVGVQPLYQTVFGPLKKFYNAACDSWMLEHPGKPMTIFDIARCVGISSIAR